MVERGRRGRRETGDGDGDGYGDGLIGYRVVRDDWGNEVGGFWLIRG